MTNPHTPTRISATIKHPESARYKNDNPWIVFEGSEPEAIKALIAETFGLDVEGLTLNEVVVNAQQQASAVATAAQGTGGTVVDSGRSSGGNGAWGGVNKGQKAQEQQAPSEPARDQIFDLIDDCATVDDLQKLWAENQAKFAEDEVMAAYKAKGKALSAAS